MNLLTVAAVISKLTFVSALGGDVILKADEMGEGKLFAYSQALKGRILVTAAGAFEVRCASEKKVTHCEFRFQLQNDDPNYTLKVHAKQRYLSSALFPPYAREYASYFGGPDSDVLLQFEAQNGWLIIHGRQGAVISIKALEDVPAGGPNRV